MVIVATLKDGRTIARARETVVVATGDITLDITVPELDRIEHVLDVEVLTTNPPVAIDGPFSHKAISTNVVNITLFGVEAGTTLTWELIAIGD